MNNENNKLLDIRGLKTCFSTEGGTVYALDGINLSVNRGEILGIVGESGSGKSVTAFSVMRLLARNGRSPEGEIIFDGTDLLKLSEKEMQKVRGNKISMIFQEPMTSLNPVYTVGYQLNEAIMLHQKVDKKEATERSIEMLRLVGIPEPERRMNNYPHQLSGGMRQRVMIAMGISCQPKLLIADEPTTALDVTIQAQILDVLCQLKNKLDGTSIILITHDMGVVAQVCDRVAVMYAGRIVETAPTNELFKNTRHWYTAGLLNSIPKMDEDRERLATISGNVPNLLEPPAGCRFHPRCPKACDRCKTEVPKLEEAGPDHKVACHIHYQNDREVNADE
jgi:oligopeptide/dipeptide ABC transporter ATP-binding protein